MASKVSANGTRQKMFLVVKTSVEPHVNIATVQAGDESEAWTKILPELGRKHIPDHAMLEIPPCQEGVYYFEDATQK